MKYWGEKSLTKIVSSFGKFLQMDQATLNKERLMFARLLIEVRMDQKFLDMIQFKNENGVIVEQKVFYAWKPIKCVNCNGYGHMKDDCLRKYKQKKVWVAKNKGEGHGTRTQVAGVEAAAERGAVEQATQLVKDSSLQQKNMKGSGVGVATPMVKTGHVRVITLTKNQFEVLVTASTEELFYGVDQHGKE